MSNALNASAITKHKILMLGDTGSGKTTQFLTLPGKKYMHIFDPNSLLSLRGYDVDYDEYMPATIGMAASSLKKGVTGDKSTANTSDSYKRFEQEFNDRMQGGFFDQYDWVGFDGATTLLDLIMDRVLTINGRFGTWPNQDDYGPVMIAFTNICRNMTALGKAVYMTGHLETKQDQVTNKIQTRPMMTGRLVHKIPLLFSDIFTTDTTLDDKGKPAYRIQTVPDLMMRTVRTCIKGLEPFENVTIDWSQAPEGQGLGGILTWEAKQLNVVTQKE